MDIHFTSIKSVKASKAAGDGASSEINCPRIVKRRLGGESFNKSGIRKEKSMSLMSLQENIVGRKALGLLLIGMIA